MVSLSDQVTYIDSYPGNKTGSISTYMAGKKTGLIWGFETVGIAKTQEEMDNHIASLPKGGQDAIGSQWEAPIKMPYFFAASRLPFVRKKGKVHSCIAGQ